MFKLVFFSLFLKNWNGESGDMMKFPICLILNGEDGDSDRIPELCKTKNSIIEWQVKPNSEEIEVILVEENETWLSKNNQISLQASSECLAGFKKLSLMMEWDLRGKTEAVSWTAWKLYTAPVFSAGEGHYRIVRGSEKKYDHRPEVVFNQGINIWKE